MDGWTPGVGEIVPPSLWGAPSMTVIIVVLVVVPIVVAIVGVIPLTIAALRKVNKIDENIVSLRVEIDGRFDKLLAAEGDAGELRGREAAHQEQTERADAQEEP